MCNKRGDIIEYKKMMSKSEIAVYIEAIELGMDVSQIEVSFEFLDHYKLMKYMK